MNPDLSTEARSGEIGPEELERILTEIGRQILENGACAANPWGCRTIEVEVCPDSVRRVIDAGACRIGMAGCPVPEMGDMASTIDHTLLKPEATSADIDELCGEALQHKFASVCVNGVFVRRAAEILRGSGVLVCAVIGFPLGAMASEVKVYEARRAVEEGACEIDMVIHVGALKAGHDDLVERDIAGVAQVCHQLGARLKVIIEACLLSDEEKTRACRLAKAAGADFVKTSTGFSKGGATVDDVALMRAAVGPRLGVKAAGGVRDEATVQAMIDAGATRVGASASVAIVTGGQATGTY